jgi:hypothetical protein
MVKGSLLKNLKKKENKLTFRHQSYLIGVIQTKLIFFRFGWIETNGLKLILLLP